ncbi:MAG: response regulator transcription factor, partial [Planctomycetota bacterium]
LTSLGGEEYVSRAIQAGASGYLVKDAAVAELAQAIDAVGRGEIYLSPGISRGVLKKTPRRTTTRRKGTWAITERQREILKLLAEGKSTKQIAVDLGLSIKTVETHRMRLMDRLGIHDVPGLVRYALRTGLTKL